MKIRICSIDLEAISSPVPGTNGRRRKLECAHRIGQHIIPAGFIWDGASITRAAWSLLGSPFIGPHAEEALRHDWLYANAGAPLLGPAVSRKGADVLFYNGCRAAGASWLTAYTMFAAVRAFGGSHWGTA